MAKKKKAAPKVKKPKLSDKELSANYGWALATLNSVPELKSLFKKAVSKQYTPERFVAEMRNTKWYQSTSEAQRKYLVLQTADPAQLVAQTNQIMAALSDQYSQLTGEVLEMNGPTLQNGKVAKGTGFLYQVADMSLKLGLNEAQIRDRLFSAVDWKKKVRMESLGGTGSGQVQAMRQQAAAYGIEPTDDWFGEQVGAVALGDETTEGVLGKIKNLSKQRYTAYADQIEAGVSISDISEGYRQSIGRVLEINPTSVDVFDKNIQKALNFRDPEGKNAPMNLNDFEDDLRRDDRWQFTQNARESLLTTGQNVLRSFGLSQ